MNQQISTLMSFSNALSWLKTGYKVFRHGWNGKGMYLELQRPDENSKMKQPYIYIVPGPEWVIPWVASQADLLAEDWDVIKEKGPLGIPKID